VSDVTIRPFHPSDTEAVAEIADAAWRGINASYRRTLGPELFALLFPEGDRRKGNEMRSLCDAQPQTIWVCERERRVVGFIMLRFDRRRRLGTIGNNAVRPELRGKGIGRRMYEFALEQFRRHGMRYAHVHTGLDQGHAAARRAYERLGFNIRLDTTDYYMKL